MKTSITVPGNSPRFDGHFPGRPVLPGVAQILDFVVPRVEQLTSARVLGVERVKFLAEVRPGDELHLELVPATARVSFRLLRQEEVVLTGRALVSG